MLPQRPTVTDERTIEEARSSRQRRRAGRRDLTTTDVTAATEIYLRQIPAGHELIAVAYTRGGYWLLPLSKVVAFAAAAATVRFGPKMLRGQPPVACRSALARIRLAATVLLMYSAFEMPWFGYAEWYRERAYGFSTQVFGSWVAGYAVQSLMLSVVGAVLLAAFYAMARRAGRGWWAWGTAIAAVGLVLALVVQPIVLDPLLHRYRPAPIEAVRGVHDLLVAAELPKAKVVVYDGSREDGRYRASVSGIGGSATVLLSDVMLARGADLSQVRAVVAHEIGHERHMHQLLLAAFLTSVVAVGLLLADRLIPPLSRLLGSGGAGIADPVGLPVLLAFFASFSLITTPLVNTAERWVEADADGYGLDLAREPDGMARAVLATADYRASSPTAVEEALFYDHPSVRHRVLTAMTWKFQHSGEARTGR